MGIQKPFWERKTLAEMTPEEWESLCDGCGKCCLYKFEDIDTKELFFTHIACKFLDLEHVRCRVYEQRARHMPSCMVLTPDNIANFYWLPETCAYRRLAEGKKLPGWHPLITGRKDSVQQSGNSVQQFAIPETEIGMERLEEYAVE